MRNRDAISLVVIVVITALAVWIDFAPSDLWLGRDVSTRLGLDLQGGTQVLLKAQRDITADELQTSIGVIDRRVNGLGVSESVVQSSGSNRIVVELPGVSDPEEAIRTLRGAGQLEFIDSQGQNLPYGYQVRTSDNPDPLAIDYTASFSATETIYSTETLTGTIYTTIASGRDLNTGQVQPRTGTNGVVGASPYAVSFAFMGESAGRLATYTSQNINQPMCIVLDNIVQSCPVIQAALVDGSGEISVSSPAEAQGLYLQLRYGSLPVSFDVESSRTVSATLGDDSVNASVVAGLIGLLAVGLFMILNYRLPGVIATVALIIYTAITFAIYRLIPVTLTLPGIAGFILSVGMAVDANVLIFARLKEELRNGRSLFNAVEMGFNEAWPAIRDSNVASLITCTILYMFGSSFGVSIIKGFALTLALGVIISMFTAVVMTRTFLRLIVPLRFAQNPWMYELKEASGLDRD